MNLTEIVARALGTVRVDRWEDAAAILSALREAGALADTDERARLRGLLERAGDAISVFAAIEPSSGVPQDGSEDEPYQVFLACRDRFDFTGKDLAKARALKAEIEEALK